MLGNLIVPWNESPARLCAGRPAIGLRARGTTPPRSGIARRPTPRCWPNGHRSGSKTSARRRGEVVFFDLELIPNRTGTAYGSHPMDRHGTRLRAVATARPPLPAGYQMCWRAQANHLVADAHAFDGADAAADYLEHAASTACG